MGKVKGSINEERENWSLVQSLPVMDGNIKTLVKKVVTVKEEGC